MPFSTPLPSRLGAAPRGPWKRRNSQHRLRSLGTPERPGGAGGVPGQRLGAGPSAGPWGPGAAGPGHRVRNACAPGRPALADPLRPPARTPCGPRGVGFSSKNFPGPAHPPPPLSPPRSPRSPRPAEKGAPCGPRETGARMGPAGPAGPARPRPRPLLLSLLIEVGSAVPAAAGPAPSPPPRAGCFVDHRGSPEPAGARSPSRGRPPGRRDSPAGQASPSLGPRRGRPGARPGPAGPRTPHPGARAVRAAGGADAGARLKLDLRGA